MGGTDPEAEAEGNMEEIEEIIEWWKEFGFEGVGRLVDGKTAMRHRRKKSKLTSGDVGISYEMDGGAGERNGRVKGMVIGKVKEREKEKEGEREMLAEKGLKGVISKGDQDSLPPSPMDDIANVVGLTLEKGREGVGVEDVEVVPMGFNLSHDLDDYLKWEAAQSAEGVFEDG